MPDKNIIEQKNIDIQAPTEGVSTSVTETQRPKVASVETTPHPENFFSNELKIPTKGDFVDTTSLMEEIGDITSTPSVNIGTGYKELRGNPASEILEAKINNEPIPSNI